MRRETLWDSIYSDMSKRRRASSLPNRVRARERHSWVLPTPVGAQEEEAAHRPPGVLQPQPPPADGLSHRPGRLVLAQQVPAQGGLQPGQGLPVGLVRVAHRDPGPLGQHRPDVLLPHGPGGLLLLPAAAARLQLPPEVPLRVPEHGRLLKVLLADGLGQLPPRLDRPLLQLPQLGREGPGGQPGLGGRLVHQVDGPCQAGTAEADSGWTGPPPPPGPGR